MLQAELKVLGGKHQGKAIPLTTKKFLVGREQDCHLRPNSDLVSRHHCVFSIDDYTVRLRDLGSTNGTRVNGSPLHGEVTLKAGDKIGIGKLELELVVRQRAASVPEPEAAPLMGLSSSELESTSSSGTIELPTLPLEAAPLSSETSFELPTSIVTQQDTSTTLTADTTIIPGAIPGTPPAFPGYPQPAFPGYPQPAYGGYPQPMAYPGQPMGFPGQYPQAYGAPGYPAMPGYPMQMPYASGFPTAAPAQPVAPPGPAADTMAVKLPPPESTGVKAPPPPAPVAAADPNAPAPKVEEKPSNTAADIIKGYMQRRTR